MENKKITAQNERYLNHTATNAASKADLNRLEKITAQNERYLNHISQKNLAIPSSTYAYRKELANKKITAQNERYLNHISQKEYTPECSPAQ